MPHWKTRVLLGDLHGAHQNKKITIRQVAAELAKRLKKNRFAQDLQHCIRELEDLSTDSEYEQIEIVELYDCILARLYDFGDLDHRIWFDPSRPKPAVVEEKPS